MRMLRAGNRPQVFAVWRDDPYSAGTRHVEITLLVDLHPIEGILAFSRSHIEKDFAARESSIRVNFVTQDDLPLLLPVVHVEVFLIGRESEPVRAAKILRDQLDGFPVRRHAKDPAIGQLFPWIIEELRQSKWRIGEIQRSVRLVDEIVGTVEPLSFIAVSQHRKLTILLQANNATVAVLIDGEPPLLVEREPVRAGLTVFANVHAAIAGLCHENGELPVLGPAVDEVIVGIAEEKVAVGFFRTRHPDRTLREQKSPCKFLDLCALRNDVIQRRILPGDLRRTLADSHFGGLVEVQRRRLDPDEIFGAIGDWSVDAEHSKLNVLAGLGVSREDHAIGSIESFNHGSARLSQDSRKFAVNPDLRIVVDHDFKSDGRTCRAELPNPFRNRNVDAVPAEAHLGCRATLVKSRGIDGFPLRIIKVGGARMRAVVVRPDRRTARL